MQMRHGADGIEANNSTVVENFLELLGGVGAAIIREVSQPSHVNRIEGPNELTWRTKLVGRAMNPAFGALAARFLVGPVLQSRIRTRKR